MEAAEATVSLAGAHHSRAAGLGEVRPGIEVETARAAREGRVRSGYVGPEPVRGGLEGARQLMSDDAVLRQIRVVQDRCGERLQL